jgi:hypothetical protein
MPHELCTLCLSLPQLILQLFNLLLNLPLLQIVLGSHAEHFESRPNNNKWKSKSLASEFVRTSATTNSF